VSPEIAEVLEGRRQWTVVRADNRDVLPTLPNQCVHHVITDPPYEAEAHAKQWRLKRSDEIVCAPLEFDPITEDQRGFIGLQCGRLASRWSLVFCQVEAVAKWASVLEAGGAKYRRACVWVKPNPPPQITGDRPGMGYESIVVAHAPGKSRWNGGGRSGVFACSSYNPESDRTGHQTQKPLPLMLELIKLFTDPGDVILDPFAGSGSTGVAAIRLGRRAICIERDARYAEIARDWLTAESQGLSLRDYRAGQLPLIPTGQESA